MSNLYNVTCAVCFDVVASGRGDQHPTRHGFSIHTRGWGHGHEGAWHSGPCFGVDYPHLGISTKGTQVALDMVRRQIANMRDWIGELTATNPPTLVWVQEPTRAEQREGKLPINHKVEQGDPADYKLGRPSYADLHRRALSEAERQLARLEDARKRYEEVLATWSPDKYPAALRVAEEAPKHLLATWKRTEFPAPQCKAFAMRRPICSLDVLTPDQEAVTCTLCKRTIEGWKREKAKRAEREAKEKAREAKQAAEPRRWYVAAELPDGTWTLVWVDAGNTGSWNTGRILARHRRSYRQSDDGSPGAMGASTVTDWAIATARDLQNVKDPRRMNKAPRWLDVEKQNLRLVDGKVVKS